MLTLLLIAVLIGGNASALLYLHYYLKRRDELRIIELSRVVRQIGDGNLNQPASEKDDRYGDLACAINDMSANIQEVLILLWKQNTQSTNLLNRFATAVQEMEALGPDKCEKILRQVGDVQKSHDDNRHLLLEFQFFGVNLNKEGTWHHEPQERKQQEGV